MRPAVFAWACLRGLTRAPLRNGILLAQTALCTLALLLGASLGAGESAHLTHLQEVLDGVSGSYLRSEGPGPGDPVTWQHLHAANLDPMPGINLSLGFVEGRASYAVQAVNEEYVHLLRLDLVHGRWPWDGGLDQRLPCVITAELAGALFGHSSPLGRTLTLPGPDSGFNATVVGVIPRGAVVAGALDLTEAGRPSPAIAAGMNVVLVAFDPGRDGQRSLVSSLWVGQAHDPTQIAAALNEGAALPEAASIAFQPALERIDNDIAARRTIASVLAAVGAFLFAASAFGMLGLMLLILPRRLPEMGLEIAVGATPIHLGLRLLAEYAAIAGGGGLVAVLVYLVARAALTAAGADVHWSLAPAVWAGVLIAHVLLALASCLVPTVIALRVSPRAALDQQ